MVIDTSAVIAILQSEDGSDRLIDKLENAKVLRISAASLVEAGVVMQARYGDAGEVEVDQFIQRLGINIAAVTEDHAEIARSAYRKFGKERHPANLNYGDCFSYALAIYYHEPLLYTGNDFAKTDVQSA